ncbi:MAG: DegV family protein [Oscillospiraceae bacterium]|jgi:DegV family protein with EDD domain|nr:DegV family protein [Oscillospiraceae bacterium]
MPDYVIFTESTSDLTKEQISNFGVEVIPLSFSIGKNNYKNDLGERDLTSKNFFDLLRKGNMSTTSQINMVEFMENFEKTLKQGKDILYLGFSSALSGTYASALAAKKELSTKYPDRQILTVDTLSASAGEGLVVYLASKNKKAGFSLKKNALFVEKNKLKVCHWIVVDSLDHLRRGGRVSQASAFLGSMLGIRPILYVNNEGKLVPVQKVRGKKTALDKLTERIKETILPDADCTVFVCHADAISDAEYLAESIRKGLDVEQIFINDMGPVIGSHAGPGTIALFFMGSQR